MTSRPILCFISVSLQSCTLKRHNARLKRTASLVEEAEGNTDKTEPVTEEEKRLFRTVYFAAHEELPSVSVNKLIKLQQLNDIHFPFQNLSWDSVHDIQESIASVLRDEVVEKLKKAKAFGLMIDENVDISVQENLVMYARFVDNGEEVTKFVW